MGAEPLKFNRLSTCIGKASSSAENVLPKSFVKNIIKIAGTETCLNSEKAAVYIVKGFETVWVNFFACQNRTLANLCYL